VDVLLRNADLALNEAKARGRDRFHVFQPDLHAAVLRKLQLHGDLRELLDRNAFSLVYQPILSLESMRPAGFEALLRWPDSAGVDATPSEAIAAAEESGLIVMLGRWVVERALHELHVLQLRWPGSRDLRMTVNLSARQLQDPELADVVAMSLHRHGIAPERLVLELTETAIAENPDDALQALQRLKSLGIRLAIDDFGTGYSSLAHLARFPFDLLKVPKPFVDMINEADVDGGRLAHAILALGASLGLETIAEGIEHPAQLVVLRDSGCTLAQGFLLGHPMTLVELHTWLDTRAPVD
jgi:EAL domain-containing protein (putative c-di-GMP-specific phosphodiesterase class I)